MSTDPAAEARNLRWLYLGRALRSLSTAFLTIVFPLYLARQGYGSVRLGLVLSLTGVITMALVAAVGLASDHYGRRMMILALAALSALGGFALAVFPPTLVAVTLASGLGGVGRGGGAGSGGSWGPVFPAEQPLVAASASPRRRVEAFGRLSFVGVMAGAAGSLLAGVPELLAAHGVALVQGYRLLFGFGGLLGVAMVFATLPIREPHPADAPLSRSAPAMPVRQLISRLGLTNALNGLAFGFLGPLLTYWFYRRFGVGPGEIGLMYTVVNLAAALPYLGSATLARRFGEVQTVVWTRAFSAVTLCAMPFLPSFAWAGVMYTLRMALNSLGMPARQSFAMGVADERHRSRVAAFGSLPSQATSTLSPAVGGALMEESLSLPLFAAAFFVMANVVTYGLAFRNVSSSTTDEEELSLPQPSPGAPPTP